MKLALGSVQFGLPYGIANRDGQVSRDEAKIIIENARLASIDTLDTAIAYGESETCLGEVGVAGFKVVTKLPAIPDNIQDVNNWVSDQMQTSLQRLNVTSLYAVLLHRSDQLLGPKGEALSQALEKLKATGMVQKIGISIYAPAELDLVMDIMPFDIVQAPFNVVDQRLYTSGWMQKLYSSGVEIHTRSAFLQGLLLMAPSSVPKRFNHWLPLWNEWHSWLSLNKISAVEACIGFVNAFPQITKIVVGVVSHEQLQEIIMASKLDIHPVWPVISSDDERLINPSCWKNL